MSAEVTVAYQLGFPSRSQPPLDEVVVCASAHDDPRVNDQASRAKVLPQ